MTREESHETTPAEDPSTGSRLYPLSPVTMSALFYIGLLLWAVVMLVLALDWGWQDRLFPVFFTGVAIVLIIIHLILVYFDEQLKQILPDTAETGSDQMDFDVGEDAEARTGEERERYELIMVAWASLLPIEIHGPRSSRLLSPLSSSTDSLYRSSVSAFRPEFCSAELPVFLSHQTLI